MTCLGKYSSSLHRPSTISYSWEHALSQNHFLRNSLSVGKQCICQWNRTVSPLRRQLGNQIPMAYPSPTWGCLPGLWGLAVLPTPSWHFEKSSWSRFALNEESMSSHSARPSSVPQGRGMQYGRPAFPSQSPSTSQCPPRENPSLYCGCF